MKILVFAPFYPPHIGGLETHSAEFNEHIAKTGVSVNVLSPRLPEESKPEETAHDIVRIFRYDAFEPITNYPIPKFWKKSFYTFLSHCFKNKPDIIVTRTRFFFVSFFGALYAKLHHIHHFHIEHGSDYAHFNTATKTFLGKIYDHTFGWIVLQLATGIVANSQASAKFVKKLSGKNAHVIYRGYNNKKIDQIEPNYETLRHKKNRVIIGYIGRLIYGKGVVDLIKALIPLKKTEYLCYIIGDGPEREKLKKMVAENDLKNNVRFIGHIPHDQAIARLKTFDIFVNPSYTEGLPSTIVEAALCRIAIIATDVGGTKEIINGKGDGKLIAAHNTSDLSRALKEYINDPHLRKLDSTKAYKNVSKKFSWEQAILQYLKVFKNQNESQKKEDSASYYRH